jgi:hypothetical protein
MFKILFDCYCYENPTFTIYIAGSLKNSHVINDYAMVTASALNKLYENSFGFAHYRIYDDWTNSGAMVDEIFIDYAKEHDMSYTDVLNSDVQTGVLNVNLDFMRACQLFQTVGVIGKSTYAEIGYVAACRDVGKHSKTVVLLKPVDKETLKPYDIMDKVANLVIHDQCLINRILTGDVSIEYEIHPITWHVTRFKPWGKMLLSLTEPAILPFEFIELLYLTAIKKMNSVYGSKFKKHSSWTWLKFKPLGGMKSVRFLSGFWGEGKSERVSNSEDCFKWETERVFRSPTTVTGLNGLPLKIPTFLSLYKYYDQVHFKNDVDFHIYYYIYTVLTAFITYYKYNERKQAPIIFDRFVFDHLAFSKKYHGADDNFCRQLSVLFASLVKTLAPNAIIVNCQLRKFNVVPFNTPARAHEFEAYGSKSLDELNAERQVFYDQLTDFRRYLPDVVYETQFIVDAKEA